MAFSSPGPPGLGSRRDYRSPAKQQRDAARITSFITSKSSRSSQSVATAAPLLSGELRSAPFVFVAINAGKSCGIVSGILKLVDGAKSNGGITCAFVSEFDAKARHFQFRANVQQWGIYRHWPGCGSFAMAFIIQSRLRQFISSIHWLGRAGAIHLCLQTTELFIVGAHLAHGAAFWDSVSDVAQVLLLKPPHARVYFAGDFNVDLLTALPDLCFPDIVDSNEVEKLDVLRGLVQPLQLMLLVPRPSATEAGGPFSNVSVGRPVSRIPEGLQCERQSPSCLDFAFAPKNEQTHADLSWHMRPADHAYLHIVVPDAKINLRFAPSTIHLKSWSTCTEWILGNMPEDVATFEDFKVFAHHFLSENADMRNREQRRRERIPQHVRDLFTKSETSLTEDGRRHYRTQALLFLRVHYQEQRARQAADRQRQGCLLRKTSHLHRITEMVLSADASGVAASGTVSSTRADWRREVEHEFASRWKSSDLHKRSVINDYLARTDGATIDISPEELRAALNAIKSSNRLDTDRLTPNCIRLFGFTCPDTVIRIVKSMLASRDAVERVVIDGQMRGKTSCRTSKYDIRTILPLPSLLCLCDTILAMKIDTYVSQLLPDEPHYFAGARKGTQTSDIVFPIMLAVEKGLDHYDEAAAAAADIKSYYDSLSPLLVARWLIQRGVPEVLCIAFLRVHVLPQIRITFDKEQFFLKTRTCGLLTGTRTANVAAKIPVGDACQLLAPALRELGYQTPAGVHAVASWVDNISSLAGSAADACQILDSIRDVLKSDWALDFKPSSMEILSVAPLDLVVMNGYLVKDDLDLLGHYVSSNGKLDYAWREVRKRVFAALFSKFKSCSVAILSLAGVAAEVQRHLWPIIKFRSNNWPFRQDIAQRMDNLQTQCIAIAAKIARESEDEPQEEFYRRRAKTAGVAATQCGRWSLLWAKQVCSWHDHNLRNSSGLLWATNVMQVRPSSWLREMRARFVPIRSTAPSPFTSEAGRLGTRNRRGGPHRRWEDAVGDARCYVEQERLTGLLKFGRRDKKSGQRFTVKAVTSCELERFEELSDYVDED